MRLVARQVATAAVFDVPVGELRPRRAGLTPRVGRARPAACSTASLAVDVRVGDRTATELVGAGDLLQPLAAARRRPARARRRAGTRSLPARLALLDDGFAERITPVAADLAARCCAAPASAPPTSTSSARSPRSRASRCGSRCCSGTSPRAGARSSPAASASRCRSRTACSASSSAPSGRRSRTRSRASRRPSSSPAATASCTCTARVEHHLAALAERPGTRRRQRRLRGRQPPARRVKRTSSSRRARRRSERLHRPRALDDQRAQLRRRHRSR